MMNNEIVYRLYDPVEKKYIKKIYQGYGYTYSNVRYTKLSTVVFSESTLMVVLKSIVEVRLDVQRLKDNLTALKDSGHSVGNKVKIDQATAEIDRAEKLLTIIDRIEIQQCKHTIPEHDKKVPPALEKKLLEKLVTLEMEKTYKSGITNWFFKHQRRVARNCKKPPFDPFCVVPGDKPYSYQVGEEAVNNYFTKVQELGIPFAKVDTYSKDIVFNCEEDYNLFKLAIDDATKLHDVIYYTDIQKKYQQIQTNILQQIENSF